MNDDRATFRIILQCSECGSVVRGSREGSFVESDERHGCWGDEYGLVAMVSSDGIEVTDDRVELGVMPA